jgi:hypothetical protein
MAAARQVLSSALVAALTGTLLGAPAASAADALVVRECTETAFRAAVAAAPDGATLTFGCDGTIGLTTAGGGVISQDRALTVDGTGRRVVLSGSGQTRLFFLGGLGSLTLRSLTVADGYAGDDVGSSIGGAVRSSSPLVVDDVRFENNVAQLAGGALAVQGGRGSLTVTRSTFVGNRASGPLFAGVGGGAIAVQAGGPTSIADSTFTRNTTAGQGSGGAFAALRSYLPSQTGPVSISGSTFVDNVAAPTMGPVFVERQGGGAVFVHNRALTITGSTFTGNHARSVHGGGAVLVQSNPPAGAPVPSASVSASTFTANTAGGAGGGIVATVPLAVDGSRFLRNRAAQGGALATIAASTLTGSIVQENVGLGDDEPTVGGLLAASTLEVSRTLLVDNTDVSCGRLGSDGRVVDGGGNSESPGSSCGFGAPAATPTSTTVVALAPGTEQAVTSVQHTDRVDLRATVSSTAERQPVQGVDVSFFHADRFLGSATTDEAGVARVGAVQVEAGSATSGTPDVQASALSTARHLGSSGAVPLAVTPEDLLMGPVQPGTSAPGAVEVSARVSEPLDGSLGQLPLSGANAVDVVAVPKGTDGTGVSYTCRTGLDSPLPARPRCSRSPRRSRRRTAAARSRCRPVARGSGRPPPGRPWRWGRRPCCWPRARWGASGAPSASRWSTATSAIGHGPTRWR